MSIKNEANVSWPSRQPYAMYGAFLLAAGFFVAICTWQFHREWNSLQRFYLPEYVTTWLHPEESAKNFYLLNVVNRKGGERLALSDEITAVHAKGGGVRYTLLDAGVSHGWVKAALVIASENPSVKAGDVHRYIGHWIYSDRTLADYTRQPLRWSLVALCGLLCGSWMIDGRRARTRKNGKRLRGAELVSVEQFNKRSGGDGIGWQHQEQGSRWSMRKRKSKWVCIGRGMESSHIMVMGDTGSGKSAAIRYLLAQIRNRGETAIVYDPALEYLPEFYNPKRGDVILNPLDARSPYWTPTDEVTHPAEALTLAASLFPEQGAENRFFVEAPKRIFAYLLNLKPTPEELTYWLSHPEEIDKRVRGTELEAMIDQRAAAQRSGVLGSLNMVADALKLLPRESEAKGRWSAATWEKERKGWIFITSKPTFREQLRPLISLWLDLLVLRLMNDGAPGTKKTWFMLDELATLQKLPQLHTVITEHRKSQNVVVLGFQGRSQMEKRYGLDAESMLSQPATKLFLKTSEPNAAEWISKSIGEEERAYLRETMTQGQEPGRNSVSESTEYRMKRLVIASQITGLRPLHGYLKLLDMTVAINFAYLKFEVRHEKFIERKPAPPTDDNRPEETGGIVAPTAPPSPAGPAQGNQILFE